MCGDDGRVASSQPSRRDFFRYAATTAALAAVPPWAWTSRMVVEGAGGATPVSMAMHIHSSFSEQYGSMDSHLFQAQTNAVDVIWWTDHDYRMSGDGYRRTVHFTSLTAEVPAHGEGGPWRWELLQAGALTAGSGGGIVASPASPRDTVATGSLHVSAQSRDGAPASAGFYAESHPSDWNYHCSLLGQTLLIEVLPTAIGRGAYLEILVGSSLHPAHGGRPAGAYAISYRVGGPGTPGSRTVNGLLGIVTVSAPVGAWTSLVLNPDQDISAMWPDMDVRDFGLFAITLSAVSSGPAASGYFDYLRFSRASGSVELSTQAQMESGYAARYSGVTQYQGLEVSRYVPHLNWFGSGVTLPDYTSITGPTYQSFLQGTLVPRIHAGGGLASYNHPYGATASPLLSTSAQNQRMTSVARTLLGNRALGADLLEVGYPRRAGVDLAHHVGLWDILSRNALFLTANGTSDDHVGDDWLSFPNNWFTSVWAAGRGEAQLLTALQAGRAWCGSLSGFRGTLDLDVDGTCPMGSASVSTASTRRVTLTATGLPSGARLQVVRGAVDFAGASGLTPNTRVIATYDTAGLAGGSASLSVDTTSSCFVRTQVVDASGTVVALSNPVWMLRAAPPRGIPAARAC